MESDNASTSSEETRTPLTATSKADMEEERVPTTTNKLDTVTTPTPGASGSGSGGGNDVDAFEKLLERQRRERMYELRRLRHGDRPVTGHNRVQRLDSFFSGSDDVTSASQRPEPIQIEISALFERRPVTSLMQSEVLRRRLESVLRSPAASPYSRPTTAPRVTVPTPSVVTPASRPTPAPRVNVPTPQAPPSVQSTNLERREDNSEWEGTNNDENVELMTPAVTEAPPLPPSYSDAVSEVERQRENIIYSISDLLQRHVVTTALDGQIGQALEALLQRRAERTNEDGARVAQFIRSLPPSGHLRNDFPDHLMDDLSDSLSMVSATAVVRDPTSSAMRRELTELRSEVSQLRRLMARSMDVQRDIQRAIRQEVAAAIRGPDTSQVTPTPPAYTPTPPVQDGICLICLDKPTDTVIYRCGHLCLCNGCALELRHGNGRCPVCRAPINDLLRVYRAGHESAS